MKIKLTAANVRTLMPDPRLKDGDTFWDTDVRSFGLRVRVSGDRGYVVRYEHGGKQKTVTLPFNLYTFKRRRRRPPRAHSPARAALDRSSRLPRGACKIGYDARGGRRARVHLQSAALRRAGAGSRVRRPVQI